MTRVIPPEIAPLRTGTTLVTALAKESFVTLTPMSASVSRSLSPTAAWTGVEAMAYLIWASLSPSVRSSWVRNCSRSILTPRSRMTFERNVIAYCSASACWDTSPDPASGSPLRISSAPAYAVSSSRAPSYCSMLMGVLRDQAASATTSV